LLTEPPLALDTDFCSNLAWVDRLDILERLYGGNMIVLEEVEIELQRVPHLGRRLQMCIMKESVKRAYLRVGSPEALEYARMIDSGRYGRGEAACMAYLKYNPGTLGSNNLRDVRQFCIDNNKCLITTADCLYEAMQQQILSKDQIEKLWADMAKKRKLPARSFSEFVSKLERGSQTSE